MSVPEDKLLIETLRLRHRPLTATEEAELEAWLSRHPQFRSAVEEERALNQLLGALPDPSVSTNFTSRVLARTRLTLAAPPAPAFRWKELFRGRWSPQLAAVTAALALGFFAHHQHQVAARKALARDLAEISRLAGSTPVELLRNFEAIQRLNQVPQESELELIAALR